jgi:hypothetical protein
MANIERRMPKDDARPKAVWGGRVRLSKGRGQAVWGHRIRRVLAPVAAAVWLSGCGDYATNGTGSSYLVLTTLTGGGGTSLQSDVVSDEGGVVQDNGQASLTVQMKDVGGAAPSPVNAITITQYHVEYIRSDGRNVPGVDVPSAFDGGVTVTISGSATVPFTLVRAQAKHEAPLRALAGHGGAQHISTIARVTFYGHDQTGRGVSVTGNIGVDFADWAG